jgi:hypothetical protein
VLTKKVVCSSATLSPHITRVGQCDLDTGTDHIIETMNSERIAFAYQQRYTPILAEEARLWADHTHLSQLSQRLWITHENIRKEPGASADLECEIAESYSASPYHFQ